MRLPGRWFLTASVLHLAACGSGPAPAPPPPPPPASGTTPIFTAPNAWTTPVATAALHPQSDAMIGQLVADGGFGGGRFQVDFSFTVLEADAATPRAVLVPSPGYYTPDCDE